jgi:hypothetical protein
MIDFTRRGGPEHPEYLDVLRWHATYDWKDTLSHVVLTFWTKSPANTAIQYHDAVTYLRSKGVTILAFVTYNSYFYPIEPYVTEDDQNLSGLFHLLGSPAIRLRWDPIIFGNDPSGKPIPNLDHYKRVLDVAEKCNLHQIVINFLVPTYKNTGSKLAKMGYEIIDPSFEQKRDLLGQMLEITPERIRLQGCAESYMFKDEFPGKIARSSCSDPDWATMVNPKLLLRGSFIGSYSRRTKTAKCGCKYWSDIGIYAALGGPPCERRCVFCYAQDNPAIIGEKV